MGSCSGEVYERGREVDGVSDENNEFVHFVGSEVVR